MTLPDVNNAHAANTAAKLKTRKPTVTNVGASIWHWINGVANNVGHFIGSYLVPAFKVVSIDAEVVSLLGHDLVTAYWRVAYWIARNLIDPFLSWVRKELAQIRGTQATHYRMLVRLIFRMFAASEQYAGELVRTETLARVKAVRHAEAQAKLEVRALAQDIQREAASGYTIDRSQRTDLIVRLLEFAGARNPTVRALVGDIAKGLLDLLEIDDPPLRILLGFLINHVIDKLGIEKPLGQFISDLMTPILGGAQPKDLHDVIADLCARLDAVEGQWAQFFADGGSEVEQAGKDWQAITSLTTSAAVVAFTVQAVADPKGWADELKAVIGVPANDVATAATALFKG